MAVVDDAKKKVLVCGCGPLGPGICATGARLWKKLHLGRLMQHLECSLLESVRTNYTSRNPARVERQRRLDKKETRFSRALREVRDATLTRMRELQEANANRER